VAESEPIIKEIFIEATPEEIFPYLTQSEKYVLWMGLTAEIDARPGGIFKVDPNTLDVIYGEFLEVSPPKRVVFTWGWKEAGHPVPAGSTRVEIDLSAQDGGTILRLTHFHVPDVPLFLLPQSLALLVEKGDSSRCVETYDDRQFPVTIQISGS